MQAQQLLESISFGAVHRNGLHSEGATRCYVTYCIFIAISVYKLFLNPFFVQISRTIFVVNKSGEFFFFV